jgi:hypothetical protein
MKQGIRNKWTFSRRLVWWTVLPIFLLLAATAQAGDLSDPGIGPPAGTDASRPEGVSTSTAGASGAVKGADLSPEERIGGVAPAAVPATGQGDPGPQLAGSPAPQSPPASMKGAHLGADRGDRPRPSLEGSGARMNASDAPTMVATQATETIERALQAVRATAFAIDALRAQLAAAIRRIDPQLPSFGHKHELPAETTRGWTAAADTGTKEPASGIKLEGELSPARGDTRPAPEASTPQITTATNPSEHEDPVSSSVSLGPAAGLGSAAQILILIGLAAAVCGFVSPAVRRRLSPRAGWLRSALLASSLEQPG